MKNSIESPLKKIIVANHCLLFLDNGKVPAFCMQFVSNYCQHAICQ
uniref:Uncharacterized protein n=1 Tax=Arundo donax TaxID=35708 RepID=A0A0A9FPQ2_ARUDO